MSLLLIQLHNHSPDQWNNEATRPILRVNVHCDLKPQNVLVTTQEAVPKLKLNDFWLAKFREEQWAITQSGDVLGTPAYMAPEQTTGKVIRAEPAIDIYGLGTIL
ncbi:MAG: protein kinase domain-containing protein [Planctomycetota bacterium]